MSVGTDPAPAEHNEAPWHTHEGAKYGIALIGYIVLGFFTKEYLTFTWGLIYFMLVLELIPRTYRRARRWLATHDEVAE